MNHFAACALTGWEADADGVCHEHGESACVVTVRVSPPVYECVVPVYECVIPGFGCMHGHDIGTVER